MKNIVQAYKTMMETKQDIVITLDYHSFIGSCPISRLIKYDYWQGHKIGLKHLIKCFKADHTPHSKISYAIANRNQLLTIPTL